MWPTLAAGFTPEGWFPAPHSTVSRSEGGCFLIEGFTWWTQPSTFHLLLFPRFFFFFFFPFLLLLPPPFLLLFSVYILHVSPVGGKLEYNIWPFRSTDTVIWTKLSPCCPLMSASMRRLSVSYRSLKSVRFFVCLLVCSFVCLCFTEFISGTYWFHCT